MDECKDTLTFDISSTQTDYLAISSILSLVNRENYEEAKAKWGVTIPEYFMGNFDDFKMERSKLTTLFSDIHFTSLSSQHFQRTLSSDAAKNYATCKAAENSDPIVAWVEKYDDNFVHIRTQNRMVDMEILCKPIGSVQPVDSPSALGPNADEILVFPWQRRAGLTVSINVKNVATGNTVKGIPIQIPSVIHFEKRQEIREKSVVIRAGAGGDGSTAGSPLYGAGAIVADLGFSIKPETLTRGPGDGIGGLKPTFKKWVEIQQYGKIVRLEGEVIHAEADNGDTQRIVDYTFTVDTVREYLVEVDNPAFETIIP